MIDKIKSFLMDFIFYHSYYLDSNIFLYSLLFGFFSYVRFVYVNNNIFLLSLFFLPATILHELSHFFVGFILGAKPSSFSILPRRNEDGFTLGKVDFSNINFINAFPTAIAPISLLIILYLLDNYLVEHSISLNFFLFVLVVYINFVLIYSGIPSLQDFRVMFHFKIGFLIWISIILGIIYLLLENKIPFKIPIFLG